MEPQLTIALDVPKSIEAPVNNEQLQGSLIVSLGDQVSVEKPIIALESVKKKNWFSRVFS